MGAFAVQAPFAIVVMGVAGAGKSLIGGRLAASLGADFLEGDAFHPGANVAKMHAGHPLDDADRAPWLAAIGQEMSRRVNAGHSVVAACSALRRIYRDILRREARRDILFVFLDGSPELLERRMAGREGHFMPASLLASQLETLEPPGSDERVLRIGIDAAPDVILARIAAALRLGA